jgi:hypothetical protein
MYRRHSPRHRLAPVDVPQKPCQETHGWEQENKG